MLVDYAHTPDSLDNVLRAARDIARGRRVISVFGAGGDRDRGKRPLMGEIAARSADVTLVTSDNPRSEAPAEIVAEILSGIPSAAVSDGSVHVEVDRRAAIEQALSLAMPADVVVIAGKGHEQGQEFADGRKEPFDDVAVARELLGARVGARRGDGRMKDWDANRVARAAGARLVFRPDDDVLPGVARDAAPSGPLRVSIDSRAVAPGDLFVGLRGEHSDGGEYAAQALQAGAWGVLVAPEHALAVAAMAGAAETGIGYRGVVLADPNPLAGLQSLARSWLAELRSASGARVVAITGSTGKTSTKDILAALLAPHLRTISSPENFNTEIGLPLAILAAPADTEALVLEMAMRGPGQIAELTAIAEPEVGVIVNVGPVHLELLGSLEAIAAAKAELIAGLLPRCDRDRARRRAAPGRAPAGRRPHGHLRPRWRCPALRRAAPTGAFASWRVLPRTRPTSRPHTRPRSRKNSPRRRRPASSCGPPSRRPTTCATCSRPSRPPVRSALRPAARLLCGSPRCAASASDCLRKSC